MDEKTFVIAFVIALVIGTGTLAFNKLQQSTTPSPTPSPDNLIFSSPQANSNTPPAGQPQNTQPQIKQFKTFSVLAPAQLQSRVATIQTQKGNIVIGLYPEATMAASNFIFLTQQSFYDGLTFHRVEAGFVIQGGDPLGNGTGGPGYRFPDELNTSKTYTRGTVAMANSGPNTNGSQFFIMLKDHPELPHQYTIFGNVISGMDVVDQIAVGDVMQKVTITH